MNRRAFIKVITGALALLVVGKLSPIVARGGNVRVIETGSGYKVIFPDGRAIHVNETGLLVLEGIRDGKTVEDIARELSSISGEPYEVVVHDVRNFVHNLKVVGIV